MAADWIARAVKCYACRPSCEQCALLGWPLREGRYSASEHDAYLHLQQTVGGKR